jgi:hypothetical protein
MGGREGGFAGGRVFLVFRFGVTRVKLAVVSRWTGLEDPDLTMYLSWFSFSV